MVSKGRRQSTLIGVRPLEPTFSTWTTGTLRLLVSNDLSDSLLRLRDSVLVLTLEKLCLINHPVLLLNFRLRLVILEFQLVLNVLV